MNQPSPCSHIKNRLLLALRSRPKAEATIAGSESCPDLSGIVRFYQTNEGVIVYAEISGLPQGDPPCQGQVFGFHIHAGTDCGGSMDDPFADAMAHYNPL